MTNRQDCKSCKKTYKVKFWDSPKAKALKKNGPPCDTCWPGLLAGNADIYAVYLRCQNQWITSPIGGLIGIRAEAIESAMRVCRTPRDMRLEVFDKIMAIGDHIAAARNEKAKDA